MSAVLNTILIYARNPAGTAAFYRDHFNFETSGQIVEGLIELRSQGTTLLIHQAAKSVRQGQATVKLMFDVRDVEGFKQASAQRGLGFGSTHQANGYSYANARDPDGNPVSISSRAFRKAER
jgi:catechol 2,3-dioxygenase-like lactoylglutathione lyase family enzyme